MAVIYITEADETQHKFRLPADSNIVVTIGRREDCLIALPEVIGLSGLHCSIALVGNEYIITDEGSSNGTLVGSRVISSEPLRAGLVYNIGTAVMTYDPEPAEHHHAYPAAAAPANAALAQAAAAIGVGHHHHAPTVAPAHEPLMNPIPVSEYGDVAEPPAAPPQAPASQYVPQYIEDDAYQGEVAEQHVPAAPAKKKKKRRKVPFRMPVVQKGEEVVGIVNVLYVLLVLAIAFYAGMTLRHWMETGNYLPGAAAETTPAAAAEE